MLFQGQEFAASTPFLYFADHKPELAELVREGRPSSCASFRASRRRRCRGGLPIRRPATRFERCKLDWSEAETHTATRSRSTATSCACGARTRSSPGQRARRRSTARCSARRRSSLRFFGEGGDDRLMLVNLGRDLERRSIPDPLVAPPGGRVWTLLWSSEHPRYGGGGTPEIETKERWRIVGHAAVVLAAAPAGPD